MDAMTTVHCCSAPWLTWRMSLGHVRGGKGESPVACVASPRDVNARSVKLMLAVQGSAGA